MKLQAALLDHTSTPYQIPPSFFLIIFGLGLIKIKKPIEPIVTRLSAGSWAEKAK
jgi:hypothetical protein